MSSIHFPHALIDTLSTAQHVYVLTGAGVSAESGVATFRGDDGIWKKFNPEELASMDAFMKNPELVWEWYEHRRTIINNVSPNDAHYTLAKMEQKIENFAIHTQNIDGLHIKAGSQTVRELHGNILRNKCNSCGKKQDSVNFQKGELLPTCECGGALRPDVVWFGEILPQDVLNTCFTETEMAEIYFSIGTSAVVHPAASLPVEAKRNGAILVEINMEPTPLTPYTDYAFHGKAGTILPELWKNIEKN